MPTFWRAVAENPTFKGELLFDRRTAEGECWTIRKFYGDACSPSVQRWSLAGSRRRWNGWDIPHNGQPTWRIHNKWGL